VAWQFCSANHRDHSGKVSLSTALGGLAILQGVWAVAASHWARKALLDYPQADLGALFKKAGEESTGAGLAIIGISIFFLAAILVFSPRAKAAELPQNFLKYGPILKAEQQRLWPNHPDAAILAALVEQESCANLRSAKCWSPSARLKSAREEGAGFGQITKAFRKDGSIRFDSLAEMRRIHNDELSDWSWENVYQRPDLQLRAIVLMSKDNAKPFKSMEPMAMLAFSDAAYNGGLRGVQQERRACSLTSGCDAAQWFGNVERHCLKSRQPLYGLRNACDINREHVNNVMRIRAAKYRDAMK
jgi:hypothetical protein